MISRHVAEKLEIPRSGKESRKTGRLVLGTAPVTTPFPLLAALFTVMLLMAGCELGTPSLKPELTVYCGITMLKPITEIAELVEQRHDCTIRITSGGSGNLLKSIRANRMGDLFIPGSESYISSGFETGTISKAVHVGYNKAAMMVAKGNPKDIPAHLDVLFDPRYSVAIGNPESGSIGRETKKILDKKGIFAKVVANASQMTTASMDLTRVIREGEADVVINWYATATWPENTDVITALPIDEQYARKRKLMLGLLSYSRHPDIAKAFMDLATSEEGRMIFDRYGLYDVK